MEDGGDRGKRMDLKAELIHGRLLKVLHRLPKVIREPIQREII